jgi:hypothetical protein
MEMGKGKFFHTVDENGDVNFQGVVRSQSHGNITAELFSWITGYPNGEKTFTENEALKWKFYKTESEWRVAGDKLYELGNQKFPWFDRRQLMR